MGLPGLKSRGQLGALGRNECHAFPEAVSILGSWPLCIFKAIGASQVFLTSHHCDINSLACLFQ